MNESAVQAVELGRDFGAVRALDGLSLEVPRGTILTLLGPNGAGKTTFLRILRGLIEPTRGQAFVLGAPSRSAPAEVSARIGYVGDRCEPPDWATLGMLEDLQAGASPEFNRELFAEYRRQLDLAPRHRYGSLSKGQRRWVLTSLALASRPDLVLLDEPADGLDLYDAVRNHVNEREATAIVTTHVIADVERVADDLAVIDGGRLALHAPLEDLRDAVRQVEVPSGSPLPDLGAHASVLGRSQAAGATVLWVQCSGPDDAALRRLLGPGAAVRNASLETLYLAVTRHRAAATAAIGEEGQQ